MDASGLNPSRRDRIPAPVWNRIVRATEIVEQVANAATTGESAPIPRAPTVLLAKSQYSGDIGRYGVVRFSGVQTDPSLSADAESEFLTRPVLSVDAPAGGDTSWGIAVDPIKPYEIGRVAISGVVPVKVNVSDSAHKHARPIASSTDELESCDASDGSVRIIWKESGTGVKWALVVFTGGGGGSTNRLCKTSAAFPKGTTATLDVWESGAPPSESQTSGVTIQDVVNKFANIASDRWVSVAKHGNGHWYVVAAEC